MVETPGGLLWRRGLWNPGVRVVVRDYANLWRRSRAPVIVHLAGDDPDELASVASTLESTPGVAGLELDLLRAHHDEAGDLEEAVEQVQAVRAAADLPILARLPLSTSDETVQALVESGVVDALVLAQPPAGLRYDAASGATITGQAVTVARWRPCWRPASPIWPAGWACPWSPAAASIQWTTRWPTWPSALRRCRSTRPCGSIRGCRGGLWRRWRRR